MHIRSICAVLLALAVGAPATAQSIIEERPAQSPSMLLFPVDEVAPAGSLEMLLVRPKNGVSAVGAGGSFGLLSRVRLVAQAAVGRPDPDADALQRQRRGWYVGASVLGVWTLAGDARTGLDLVVGVQADHATANSATRTSAPSGLTARATQSISGVDLQPFVGGGVALRNDNRAAHRQWNVADVEDAASTAGWFAHAGVRVASGRFWVQSSMTWSKVFGDGGFPPVAVTDATGSIRTVPPAIEHTPLLTLRAGFSP